MPKVVITYSPSNRPTFKDRPFLMVIGSSHIRLTSDDLDAIVGGSQQAKVDERLDFAKP